MEDQKNTVLYYRVRAKKIDNIFLKDKFRENIL
jgi:hypothetical protein